MYDLLLGYLEQHKVDLTWDANGQQWARDTLVYDALFLIMASPEYAVQR
jgi:hypothetical protein